MLVRYGFFVRFFVGKFLLWTAFVAVGAACGRGGDVPSSRDRGDLGDASTKASRDSAKAPVDVPAVNLDEALLPPTERVEAPEEPPRCEDAKDVYLFATPRTPFTGAALHVLAVTDKPLVGELVLTSASKKKNADVHVIAKSAVRHGGPPYFWTIEVPSPRAGKYTVTLSQSACEEGTNTATRTVYVASGTPTEPTPPTAEDGSWLIRSAWSRRLENVYSAWIETLFDAPDGEMPSWSALHELLRDKKRNLLFDYLAAGEDSKNAPVIRPDCADLPYFLRAYFSFKLGLPFGVSECNRGGSGLPPSCKNFETIDKPPVKYDPETTAVKSFQAYLRGTLADRAHSGSGRTLFEDQDSDYYPVPLSWEGLRPGTVYADPYGHVLVVAKRLPQTKERGGVLLAVDGQPDGTVARKRFWRGNFLYAHARELGGPGFKRFRPIVKKDDAYVKLDDEAILKSPDYGDLSRAPGELDIEPFYDRMDDVMSPRPLDPKSAMLETIDALEEQVRTRVKSVDNGRKWLETAQAPATMPDGADIFETTGEWEDFATPSRDLRMLLAIDVVRGFPARVARRLDHYAVRSGVSPAAIQGALESLLEKELGARSIVYTRTDGSSFTLSLAEVLARAPSLEMAYNLNDCVESRWGAPEGSDESKTCRSHAPDDQRAKMNEARPWFHDRRRPPRK